MSAQGEEMKHAEVEPAEELGRKELDLRLIQLDTEVNESRAQEKHTATLMRIIDLDEQEKALEKEVARLTNELGNYVGLSKDEIQEQKIERAGLRRSLRLLEENRAVLTTEKREKEAIVLTEAQTFIDRLIEETKEKSNGNQFVQDAVEKRLAVLAEVATAIKDAQTHLYPLHPLRYKSRNFYYLLGEEDPDADNSGRVAVVLRHCDRPHGDKMYILIGKVDMEDHPETKIVTMAEDDATAVSEIDGCVYFGQLNARGERNGKGMSTYSDGTMYEGEWDKNVRVNAGTMHLANGSVYVGSFDRDTMHGSGTMSFPNGDHYEGAFFRNKREGHAKMDYANGEKYEGAFKENVREGYGTCIFTDGLTYAGEWANDVRMGQGVLSNEAGGCYDGPWKGDAKHGDGAVHFGDGVRYDGMWKQGTRRGQASNFTVSADAPCIADKVE